MTDGVDTVLGWLLEVSHTAGPDAVPALAAEAAAMLGATDAVIYLVDFGQRALIPLASADTLAVDGTLPGRVYTSGEQVEVPEGDGIRLWFPLRDGTDRLGVFGISFPEVDDERRRMALRLTFLVAELVVAKNQYGDRFFLARKRKEMDLAAQIQWQLLPPLTFASEEVVVAAALEPAYDVGGDSFDYALDGDTLHVVLFDAMGHGVEAALIAALAVTAYRDGRRRGESLAQRLADVDAAVNAHFGPDRFTTAVAADLHVPSGRLTWMNAGHPRPLLLRRDRVVGALECEPGPPLGLKLGLGQTRTEQLEPGDHLLMFTDGMVEARSARGEAFGFTRLTDFFSREVQAGQPASETMRRLTHALLDYHGGRLQDDATVLMVGWRYSG